MVLHNVLSRYVFVLCIQDTLETIVGKYLLIIYADDILIAIKQDQAKEDAILFISEEFNKIGLTINPNKCKCTRNEKIKFMGTEFKQG